MSDELLNKAKVQWLMWRLTAAFFVFYSLDAIATAFVSVMIDASWSDLSGTQRWIRVALVTKAWATAMLALFTNAQKKLSHGDFPIGNDSAVPPKPVI